MDQSTAIRIYKAANKMKEQGYSSEASYKADATSKEGSSANTIAGWSLSANGAEGINWSTSFANESNEDLINELEAVTLTDDTVKDITNVAEAVTYFRLYNSLLKTRYAFENGKNVEAEATVDTKTTTDSAVSGAGHSGATMCNNGIIDFASFAQTLAFKKALKYGLNENAQKTIHKYITDFMAKFYHQLYYIPTLKDDMVMLVKPETLFIYAPSCNVILPTMKQSINYDRSFKAEATRLLQVTNPVMAADSAAARNNASQTLVCLAYVDQDGRDADGNPTEIEYTVDGMPKHHYTIKSRAKKDAKGVQCLARKSDHALSDLTYYESENGIRLTVSNKGADLWLYMAQGNWRGSSGSSTGTTGGGNASSVKDNTDDCKKGLATWDSIFEAKAKKYNLNKQVLMAIAYQESKGNPSATENNGGSYGVMQIVAKYHGFAENPEALFDPETCIEAGAKYLRECLNAFQEDYHKAIWSYNQGTQTIKDAIAESGDKWETTVINNAVAKKFGDSDYYNHVTRYMDGKILSGSSGSTSQVSVQGTLQLTTAAKSGAGLTLAKLCRYELARVRFASRTGSCSMYFDPYLVPGFPFVSIEPTSKNTGLTIYGYITSVVHSFTARSWSTTFSFNSGRTEDEDTPRVFPIVESEYTDKIADTYKDMLGEHIKSVTADSVTSFASAYQNGSGKLGESLARVWREITPIAEHLQDICDGATIVDKTADANGLPYHYWVFENGPLQHTGDPYFFNPKVQSCLEEYVQAIQEGYALSNEDVR